MPATRTRPALEAAGRSETAAPAEPSGTTDAAEHPDPSGIPDAAGFPHPRSSDIDEYEHLDPLLHALSAMAHDDPGRGGVRDRIITGYLPVARNIAHRYARRGEPLSDLIQVASLGLIKAVDRFEPDQGHNFLSFAVPTITGEIRRHFRDRTWSMRVPRRLKELHVAVNNAIEELSTELNRAPRPGEIATRLSISVNEVLEALQASQSYRSFSLEETLPSESASTTLSDLIGRAEPDFDRFTNSHALAPHLTALAPREREILIMRFYDDLTQTQIAERIGVSQMHVSRLLSTTLSRLRDAVDTDLPAETLPTLGPKGGARRAAGRVRKPPAPGTRSA